MRLTISQPLRLTPAEVAVLSRLATGMMNREIAFELGVKTKTVEAHVSHIADKVEEAFGTRPNRVLLALLVQGGTH